MVNLLISIIVPIYNIEHYLSQCVESLMNQTYERLEIILVDDGSTDASGAICDTYRRSDKRIRVIHKENGGLVSARKAGLSIAKGDYCLYVDGDDWIEPDTVERLLLVNPTNVDIVTFACIEEYGPRSAMKCNKLEKGLYAREKRNELYKRMLMTDTFYEFGILPHLADKLIRREILLNNQFKVNDSISYGEDAACTYPCLMDAETIFVTNLPLYHYRQRLNSVVKQKSISTEGVRNLYHVLNKKMENNGLNVYLKEQLIYYIWFCLLIKHYDRLANSMTIFPFEEITRGSRVALYGAGGFGQSLKKHIDDTQCVELICWVDQNASEYIEQGMNVKNIDALNDISYDYLIIGILNEKIAEEVVNMFIRKGYKTSNILYITSDNLKKWDFFRELLVEEGRNDSER